MELKIRAQDRKRSIPGICLPSIDQERIYIGGVFFLCRHSHNERLWNAKYGHPRSITMDCLNGQEA
jgi:hypothetical protein